MTKIDRYYEIEVTVHKWEGVCYWCAKIFIKGYNRGNQPIKWREHVNMEHETKIFCSDQCRKEWREHKHVFGELMP